MSRHTLHIIGTLNCWTLIWKIVAFHYLSLRAPLAGRAANSRPKQLWETNRGGRLFSTLWRDGSMCLYVMWLDDTFYLDFLQKCVVAWQWLDKLYLSGAAGWSVATKAWNCSNFSFMIVDQSNDFLLTLQIKNFFLGKCSSFWLASLKPIILQSVFLDFSQGIEILCSQP